MTIKLTSEEMRYIALFEGITGARVHDCVIEDGGKGVIFVVKKGDIGLAIGRGGSKIRRAKRVIGKSISVVEYFDELADFLKNILSPVKIKNVNLAEKDGKKIAVVTIDKTEGGRVSGKRIRNAKKIASRHYDVHDITLV